VTDGTTVARRALSYWRVVNLVSLQPKATDRIHRDLVTVGGDGRGERRTCTRDRSREGRS